MFMSVSLQWLGSYESETMKSFDLHADRQTQPFIVEDFSSSLLMVDDVLPNYIVGLAK